MLDYIEKTTKIHIISGLSYNQSLFLKNIPLNFSENIKINF